MAAKPKRVQARKGRQQPAKQSRGVSGRKSAKHEQMHARGSRQTNGREEQSRHEKINPMMAGSHFAEAVGLPPQVMGWSGKQPGGQFENMLSQLWNLGGNGSSSRYMRAMAQANVEMMELLGRRGRAYLNLPANLAQCRTPQQMWGEQARFIQDMIKDCQVANDRMVNCWMEAATVMTGGESQRNATS